MSVSQTPTDAPVGYFQCLATWPTDATQGDLMAGYLRPEHRCKLGAGHVHDVVEQRLDDAGQSAPYVQPHVCHCGTWQPVRDVDLEQLRKLEDIRKAAQA